MALNWIKNMDDVSVDALLLLEDFQLRWIDENACRREWGALFRARPYLAQVLSYKAPEKADWVRAVTREEAPEGMTMRQIESSVLRACEDWIVYAVDPDIYHNQPFVSWDERELTAWWDFSDKRVVDVGSGTGKQAFAVAPLCRWVYCVEPVASLRKYLIRRKEREGVRNMSVTDGFIERLPFEDGFADVVTGGHVFGDDPEREMRELLRIVKPGGAVLLVPGNGDRDNDIHRFLLNAGCAFGRFEEPGDGIKRKYRLIKPA